MKKSMVSIHFCMHVDQTRSTCTYRWWPGNWWYLVKATIEMIERLGGVVAGCAFWLSFLMVLMDVKLLEGYDTKVLMNLG